MTDAEQQAQTKIKVRLRKVFDDTLGSATLQSLMKKDAVAQDEMMDKAWEALASEVLRLITFNLGHDRMRMEQDVRECVVQELLAEGRRLALGGTSGVEMGLGMHEAARFVRRSKVGSEVFVNQYQAVPVPPTCGAGFKGNTEHALTCNREQGHDGSHETDAWGSSVSWLNKP